MGQLNFCKEIGVPRKAGKTTFALADRNEHRYETVSGFLGVDRGGKQTVSTHLYEAGQFGFYLFDDGSKRFLATVLTP
uniref:Uncharacterized protein n=1 Tax=Helianthus annuus TaxID=4232 RepID=A0A251S6Q3_HELAN